MIKVYEVERAKGNPKNVQYRLIRWERTVAIKGIERL